MLVERVINSGWTGSHRSTPTFEARGGVMRPTAPCPVTDIHLSWATFYTWSSRVILNIYRWTRYYRKPCFWYEMIKRRAAYTVTMLCDSTDSLSPVLKHATPTSWPLSRCDKTGLDRWWFLYVSHPAWKKRPNSDAVSPGGLPLYLRVRRPWTLDRSRFFEGCTILACY